METTSPTSLAYLSFSLSPFLSLSLSISRIYLYVYLYRKPREQFRLRPTHRRPSLHLRPSPPPFTPSLSHTFLPAAFFFPSRCVRRCARDDGVVRRRLREQRDPLQRRRCCRCRRRRRRGARFECSSFPSFLASSRVSREGEGMKEGPCERARGGKERMNTYTCMTWVGVCVTRARAHRYTRHSLSLYLGVEALVKALGSTRESLHAPSERVCERASVQESDTRVSRVIP